MTKDEYGNRYTSIRSVGWEYRIKAQDDVSFLLHYLHSELGFFAVMLKIEGEEKVLFGLHVSFCISCGRFLGFGKRFEVCWECADEFEELEEIF